MTTATFAPTATDICITRGDTPTIPVQVTDDQGTPIDITGGTFVLTVDPSDSPTDAVNNLFSTAGVITDAANGRVSFSPTAVDTDQSPGEYFYDIEGNVPLQFGIRTILKGGFQILQDISK